MGIVSVAGPPVWVRSSVTSKRYVKRRKHYPSDPPGRAAWVTWKAPKRLRRGATWTAACAFWRNLHRRPKMQMREIFPAYCYLGGSDFGGGGRGVTHTLSAGWPNRGEMSDAWGLTDLCRILTIATMARRLLSVIRPLFHLWALLSCTAIRRDRNCTRHALGHRSCAPPAPFC